MRAQKKPRNYIVLKMILNNKGGLMKDRRLRRPLEEKRKAIEDSQS